MSFQRVSNYRRHILQPLDIPNSGSAAGRQKTGYTGSRSSSKSSLWTASTHTVLGNSTRFISTAWPPNRFNDDPSSIPDDPIHNVPYDGESAKLGPNEVYEMYNAEAHTRASDAPLPLLVVKRYIPTNRTVTGASGLTLLLLPGMGLPKEVFEPTIDYLVQKHEAGEIDITELWSVDMPMSGETALVNPQGYFYANEKDIARDILLFLTAYLPLRCREDLPSELIPRHPNGQVRSNLHVAGHSLGAQSAMLIAAHAPNLFASVTVFDPAIIPAGKIRNAFAAMPKDVLCTNVRYVHESRDDLEKELRSNRRTRGWDERVVKLFREHGAVTGPDGKVRLSSHPRLEWAMYYDQETPTHCYDRLQDIRTPLNAIMPARPFAVPSKMLEADLMKLPQETRLTFVPGTTHQLPFERVDECGDLLVGWLKERSLKGRTRVSKL